MSDEPTQETAPVPDDDSPWVEVRCHLCGKTKRSLTESRALYELAFHYDRRHRGWTDPAPTIHVHIEDQPRDVGFAAGLRVGFEEGRRRGR